MIKHSHASVLRAAGLAITAALLGAAFAMARAGAAEQAATLDGWGGLRLGMTVDEARAVAAYKWLAPETADVQTGPGTTAQWTILKSSAPVRFADRSFDFEVDFDGAGKLNQIKLQTQLPGSTVAACDAAFVKLLTEGEHQFGSLRPVQPAQAEARNGDLARKTQSADWFTTIEHRPAPAGKSTYEYRTDKWRKTAQSAWHVYLLDNAISPFSQSYAELNASLNPPRPCVLFVGIAAGAYPFEKAK